MTPWQYWAKQDKLPLSRLATIIAEHEVVTQDVRPENFDLLLKAKFEGYMALFTSYIAEFVNPPDIVTDVLVDVEHFVKWAYGHDIKMPPEFLVLIDEMKPLKMTESAQDKLLCRGIARTLWYEHPNWSQEQIVNHHAVQVYGSGSDYSTKVLKGWISGFDPRDPSKKPGARKKMV